MSDNLLTLESAALAAAARRYAQAPGVVGEELRRGMREAVLTAEREVVERTPVDEGRLRNSIVTDILGQGADLVGVVMTQQVPYAAVVELGSRPHWPPRQPLEGWVKRVLGVPATEARRVAFLVARAISKRGTKAVRMFGEGRDAARPAVQRAFRNAARRIRERLQP